MTKTNRVTKTHRVTVAPNIYAKALMLSAKEFSETGVYTPISVWFTRRLQKQLGQSDLRPINDPKSLPKITLPIQLIEAIKSEEMNLDEMLQNTLT